MRLCQTAEKNFHPLKKASCMKKPPQWRRYTHTQKNQIWYKQITKTITKKKKQSQQQQQQQLGPTKQKRNEKQQTASTRKKPTKIQLGVRKKALKKNNNRKDQSD